MSKQFIFVNVDGDYEQSTTVFESGDFITTSTGLPDAAKPVKTNAIGQLDSTFINATQINHNSLLNTHNLTTDINHSNISGLSNDDHSQYILVSGIRNLTGVLSYDAHKTFTGPTELIDKKYVDDKVAATGTAAEWQVSVKSVVLTPPGVPGIGDRYLINGIGTGSWSGHDFNIAEWDGSVWGFINPSTGTYVSVDDQPDGMFYFGGTGPWVKKIFETTTASQGCVKVGQDIQVSPVPAGGLKIVSNQLAIEANDIAGEGLVDNGSDKLAINWSTLYNDSKAIKASDLNNINIGKGASLIGINDALNLITATNVESALQENRQAIDAIEDNVISSTNSTLVTSGTIGADNLTIDIDWSTSFNDSKAIKASDLNSLVNGKGASLIGIEDANGYTLSNNVEGALQDLFSKIDGYGNDYIVGSGGVTKGDLLYISAANTVRKLDPTASNFAIGIAAASVSSGGSVKVLGNDNVIKGILSGATAGAKYFWTSTGWTSIRPTSSGLYVWLGGISKSSTDLQIEVLFIMKNA